MLFLQYPQVHTQINFGAFITIDKLILHAYTEVLGYGPTQLNHTTKYLSSIHVSLFQVNIALRCFLHNHDNIAKDGRDYALPLSNNCLHRFFIVHSAIDITAHSIPFNSLEHCICTTSMTNIRPDQDLNPVALSFEPKQDRMGHWASLVIPNTNKLILAPIIVASNMYKHDKWGMGPSLGSSSSGMIPCIGPLCPHVRCEILPVLVLA